MKSTSIGEITVFFKHLSFSRLGIIILSLYTTFYILYTNFDLDTKLITYCNNDNTFDAVINKITYPTFATNQTLHINDLIVPIEFVIFQDNKFIENIKENITTNELYDHKLNIHYERHTKFNVYKFCSKHKTPPIIKNKYYFTKQMETFDNSLIVIFLKLGIFYTLIVFMIIFIKLICEKPYEKTVKELNQDSDSMLLYEPPVYEPPVYEPPVNKPPKNMPEV